MKVTITIEDDDNTTTGVIFDDQDHGHIVERGIGVSEQDIMADHATATDDAEEL